MRLNKVLCVIAIQGGLSNIVFMSWGSPSHAEVGICRSFTFSPGRKHKGLPLDPDENAIPRIRF